MAATCTVVCCDVDKEKDKAVIGKYYTLVNSESQSQERVVDIMINLRERKMS